MTLTTIPLPYGLRDIKIVGFTTAAATVLSTPTVDLPYARTLSFSEAEEFEELRGDDTVVTTRGKGPSVNWELEGGGISFEALKVLNGGTITETGVTPNQVKKYRKLTTDARPFFHAEGQSISDSGGDVHCVLHRCRASGEIKGEFGDGVFFMTGASGVGLGSLVTADLGALYDFVQNETATANT